LTGLGPRGSSLLRRLGRMDVEVFANPFTMQLEQMERGEARRLKAIWHATRRGAHRKPEAPVETTGFGIHQEKKTRLWIWTGEEIPSKGMYKGILYSGKEIRKAGYKLPKLVKPAGGKAK
jgi:hypothetical protein